MVGEVRIYVEGGGDGKDTKARIREGFRSFLSQLVERARAKRIRWSIIACGGRSKAHHAFLIALKKHGNAFNVLLVDSEGPVDSTAWQHLNKRDHWQSAGADDACCHLMVQAMEAWIIADPEALGRFYGQGFNPNALPANRDVEAIDKATLDSALRRASRTTTKGEYHKIRHAAKILQALDPQKVQAAAPQCRRLFATLAERIA